MKVGINNSQNLLSSTSYLNMDATLRNFEVPEEIDDTTAERIDSMISEARKGMESDPENWTPIYEKALDIHSRAKDKLINQKAREYVETPKEREPEVVSQSDFDVLDEDSLRNIFRNATISIINKIQEKDKNYVPAS